MADEWTDEQLTLLLEFYYFCDEASRTDGHAACAGVANDLSAIGPARTSAAVDLVCRNAKWVDTGGTAGMANASAGVKRLVAKYQPALPTLRTDAAATRTKYSLPPLMC